MTAVSNPNNSPPSAATAVLLARFEFKTMRLASSCQILRGDGSLRGFVLPLRTADPPAFAVVHQLNAVDATHHLGIVGCLAGVVTAPDVGDVAVRIDAFGDFMLQV